MDKDLDTFLKELELSGLRVQRGGFGPDGQVISIHGVNKAGLYWVDHQEGHHTLTYLDRKIGKAVDRSFDLQGAIEHLTKMIREEDG